jgi:hypothetical protein
VEAWLVLASTSASERRRSQRVAVTAAVAATAIKSAIVIDVGILEVLIA